MTRSIVPLSAAVFLCLGPNLVWAQGQPSFDCAKASSAIEKVICANADLSARDRALTASYVKAQAALSDEGKGALRTSQRQWLRSSRELCDSSALKRDKISEQVICLAQRYELRQKQLETVIEIHGGLVFRRDDHFASSQSAWIASYPQIDSPTTPSMMRWNERVAEKFKKISEGDNPDQDQEVSYDIILVSSKMISVLISNYIYPHGANHGYTGRERFHWLLNSGREMRSDDLFERGKNWQKTILSFCFKDLKARDYTNVKDIDELGTTPIEPGNWSFNSAGLTIHFDPYAVASFADGPQEVLVPWSLLRGFLVKDPPVSIP